MTEKPVLLWFRQDLRLADNPALAAAAAAGAPVAALFVLDDDTPGRWRWGGASRWWLHRGLAALQRALGDRGVPLILRRGRADAVVPQVAAALHAGAVHWNRCYEPFAIARDTTVKATLRAAGIAADSHNAGLLAEPWTVTTGAGAPYAVFTPVWRALRAGATVPVPTAAPKCVRGLADAPAGDTLADWRLLPTSPDWAGGFAVWRPGEAGARAQLDAFLDGLDNYGGGRDRPDRADTSRLSPHLHWGEIGPRQVWHAALARAEAERAPDAAEPFLRELGWREFAHHLLYHRPEMTERPLRSEFVRFPWQDDAAQRAAWQRGRTGYPLVDAGLRQLWATGWMHNRVRMVAASFLVKHLLQPWQHGAAWFWDTLVDADLANNSLGWQWVAGCGADAAPFFRIFNPVAQGERFDPDGAYVRRWLPELARLPAPLIHRPWTASALELGDAGIRLGADYPRPMVDHGAARAAALAAFAEIKRA
ncbi:MAG: deoxyribodipyrimidine photo-lyase [Alphaproteobacteria bacterium]